MGVFKILDMTCGHCEMAIKSELAKGDPEVIVNVDVEGKMVRVENLSDDRVMFLLREIGYRPQKVR